MSVVNAREVRGVRVSAPYERLLKVCMSPEDGRTKDFTLLVSIISPGSGTNYHCHEESGELIYVVSGYGKATIEGKEFEVGADTAIYAPLGVRHMIRNASDETMKLVCVFVPPLPPQYVERAAENGRQVRGE